MPSYCNLAKSIAAGIEQPSSPHFKTPLRLNPLLYPYSSPVSAFLSPLGDCFCFYPRPSIMASSNRHWPSMFKSKHCNTHHLQWQHDVNPSSLISNSCHRTEERAPEPKPRWNPKPEQVRILEAIFNSGMVNPPRDEIRRIRSQLQEYGQVGDANVFYWFQNRKSRSKHKLRHLQAQRQQQQRSSNAPQTSATPIQTTSSSSSSERSGSSKATVTATTLCVTAVGNASTELCGEPLVAAYLSSLIAGGGGHEWKEMVIGKEGKGGGGEAKLELESVFNNGCGGCKVGRDAMAVASADCSAGVPVAPPAMSCPISGATQGDDGVIGGGDVESTRSVVVFINDVAFEVEAERLNVMAAFGNTAVLLHSSGQPVLVDQWGVTLQPLHHGASYYLV